MRAWVPNLIVLATGVLPVAALSNDETTLRQKIQESSTEVLEVELEIHRQRLAFLEDLPHHIDLLRKGIDPTYQGGSFSRELREALHLYQQESEKLGRQIFDSETWRNSGFYGERFQEACLIVQNHLLASLREIQKHAPDSTGFVKERVKLNLFLRQSRELFAMVISQQEGGFSLLTNQGRPLVPLDSPLRAIFEETMAEREFALEEIRLGVLGQRGWISLTNDDFEIASLALDSIPSQASVIGTIVGGTAAFYAAYYFLSWTAAHYKLWERLMEKLQSSPKRSCRMLVAMTHNDPAKLRRLASFSLLVGILPVGAWMGSQLGGQLATAWMLEDAPLLGFWHERIDQIVQFNPNSPHHLAEGQWQLSNEESRFFGAQLREELDRLNQAETRWGSLEEPSRKSRFLVEEIEAELASRNIRP